MMSLHVLEFSTVAGECRYGIDPNEFLVVAVDVDGKPAAPYQEEDRVLEDDGPPISWFAYRIEGSDLVLLPPPDGSEKVKVVYCRQHLTAPMPRHPALTTIADAPQADASLFTDEDRAAIQANVRAGAKPRADLTETVRHLRSVIATFPPKDKARPMAVHQAEKWLESHPEWSEP